MKTARRMLVGITYLVHCFLVWSLVAADGIWTNDLPGKWGESTNWLNGVVADGVGAKATIAPQLSSPIVIGLEKSYTIGELEAQAETTLTNDGNDSVVLTFAVEGTTPRITPIANVTISRLQMAGSQGLIVEGGGRVTFYKENGNPSNTITGGLTLSGGVELIVGGVMVDGYTEAVPLAVGSLGSVTFLNGSLSLRPSASTVEPGTAPVSLNLYVPEGANGTLVLPLRWSGSSGDGVATPGVGLGGSLTGKGTLTVDSRYVRGNIVGNWSDFEGTLRIYSSYLGSGQNNDFRYGGGPGFPKATVELFGTQYPFTFRYYLGLSSNTTLNIGRLMGSYDGAYVAGSATAAYTLFWRIGGLMSDPNEEVTFAGSFVNGSGPCGVIYVGAGKWILTGNNTHTGGFTVSNGVVQIGDGWGENGSPGDGPITNYAKLIFARSGTLNLGGALVGAGVLSNVGQGTIIFRGTNIYSGPIYIDQGRLVFSSHSHLTGTVNVNSGAGIGIWSRTQGQGASIANLVLGADSSLSYDFGSLANPNVPVITNTGSLQVNGTVTVSIVGEGLGVGTIPLLKYGARSGMGTFVLGSVPPYITQAYLQDDTANGLLSLVINSVFDTSLVWKGDQQGIWNFTGSEWIVAGSGARTNYYDGAAVRFDDSAVRSTVQLDYTVYPQRVTFENATKEYLLAGNGQIAGNATLIKRGSGKVILNTANTYTGGVKIEEGILQVGDGTTGAILYGSGNITNNGVIVFKSVANHSISSVISSENTTNLIVQEGPGELRLSGANTFIGTVEVKSGASFVNDNGSAIGGTGSRLLLSGGTVYLNQDISSGRQVVVASPSIISCGTTRRVDSPIYGTNATLILSNSGLLTIHSSLRGFSGKVILASPNGSSLRFNAGSTVCDGCPTAVFVFQPASGYTNWLFNRNSGVTYLGGIEGGPGLIDQQSVGGGANLVTYLVGDAGVDNVFTGVIQDSTRWTAFIKVGPAALTLSNCLLNHKGTFGVTNGVLRLVGDTAVSSVTTNVIVVAPGILDLVDASRPTLTLGQGSVVQPLRGNGTIRGNVVLGSNARLIPGRDVDATIGVLTVMGNVTLGGITLFELDRAASPNSDRLVANSIAGGGQLIVTNIGATLQAGDTFQLFSQPVSGFSSVTLPPLPSPLYWTNKLAIDGTIQVLSTVATNPTNVSYRVTDDGQIEISWPQSHIGWTLQMQTNTLAVGLSTNWVDVTGSTLTNKMAFPLSGTNQTTFFRLILRQ